MVQALLRFERLAAGFWPGLLVGAGILLVLGGICLWLGGLRWLRVTAGIIGALVFTIGAILAANGNAAVIFGAAAFGAVLGCVFRRSTVLVTGAVLAGVIVALIFAGGGLVDAEIWGGVAGQQTGAEAVEMTLGQSVGELKVFGLEFLEAVGKSIAGAGAVRIAIAVGGGIVAAAVGCFVTQLFTAFTCAVLGTLMIFVGMGWLLIHKGAMPFSILFENFNVYLTAVVVMIVLGTTADLMLCGYRRVEKTDDNDGDEK